MQSKIKHFFTEPFVQFLVLGGLLYVLVAYVEKQGDKQAAEITVDGNQVSLMLMNYKSQTGNLPTRQQLDAMINSYIKEEISYREAKKMGLDIDDEIVRRRLSQKFEFLQSDLTEVPAPTEKEVKQFYHDNPALFRKETSVSFSHIYFSTDNSNDSAAKQRAVHALQQLQQTSLQRAPEMGDRFALQYDYTNQVALDIQQNFGSTQLMDKLFTVPEHTWTGPVQSGYGWHLIYVSKRDSAALIPFATIKDDVTAKCTEALKAALNKKVFDELAEKYSINRSYLDVK